MRSDSTERTIVVTGGAGFIGSALVRSLVRDPACSVVVMDALTYAGNLESLHTVLRFPNCSFERIDITDAAAVRRCFATYSPEIVYHLAAESHVDRSIDSPAAFIHTNVVGTYILLDAALGTWKLRSDTERAACRFIHVSTDEVFGSLGEHGKFSETTPYAPRSPYSASKAGADHLARAWHHTFGLPVIVTNCSNNFGPYQFPEKFIPVVVRAALNGDVIPVYGRGANIRDWLYVDDHVEALRCVAERGRVGGTYAFGGGNERSNLDVVTEICSILDEMHPNPKGSYDQQISFVADRPGHDFRYAVDSSLAQRELGWKPAHTFEQGLRETVEWYLQNDQWSLDVMSGAYRGERLGLGGGV